MLYQKISDDIKQSMKEKNTARLEVLRMIKSKIMTVDARGELSEEDIIKIIKSYQKSLKDAMEQTTALGRNEEAKTLSEEIRIVDEYLPKMLSEEELKKLITAIINQNGYTSSSDFGKVMKELKTKNSNIDGNTARTIINEILT
ncbi:MAG: hypothetical protein DKM50_06090 [Candidatus Margulisiibacteriota bacterium]|nr:MAG: hypothetical protein DKM50_06090 [Candidatus Margulisiibacteriota bacterium]HAR62617.1 hypothetical protein [Candidatus Margulisiibacteriota bacterium]HCT84343.1 hypothetical protein [Candidatus Margulisiibacteriota bacterium]HCY35763.1 hypothetical protein [Candidatus Margulisiibacteriota bacterium]